MYIFALLILRVTSSCPQFTYNDSSSCQSCLVYCSACVNATSCISCVNGMYYDASIQQCLNCSYQCFTCTDNSCLLCNNGYYSSGKNCYPCFPGCNSCSNSTDCQVCQNGYQSINGSCVASCSPNCVQCGEVCMSCASPYHLISGQCILCPPSCNTCTNSTFCQTCQLTFTNYLGSCYSCIPNCQSCVVVDSSQICVLCSSGYFLMSNSSEICYPCATGCTSCNQYACIATLAGYGITANGSAVFLCPQNCQYCMINQCISCNSQYFVQNGSCLPCSYGCQVCSSANVCVSCLSTFNITSTYTCQSCPVGCKFCNFTNQCTSCLDGYRLAYLQPNTPCVPCQDNCAVCTINNLCQYCQQNYILNEQNQCINLCSSYISNCNKCIYSSVNLIADISVVCYDCQEGYALITNKCQSLSTYKIYFILWMAFMGLFIIFLIGFLIACSKLYSKLPETQSYYRRDTNIQLI